MAHTGLHFIPVHPSFMPTATFAFPRPLSWSTHSTAPQPNWTSEAPSPGPISRKPSLMLPHPKFPTHLAPLLPTLSPQVVLYSGGGRGGEVGSPIGLIIHVPAPLGATHWACSSQSYSHHLIPPRGPRCRLDSPRKPSPDSYPQPFPGYDLKQPQMGVKYGSG